MINSLLILALGGVVTVSGLGARALYRLHRQCRCVECSPKADSGLLRWYAQGFERPLAIARWLVRIDVLLLVTALLGHAHPLLIAAGLVSLILAWIELRFGGKSERQHQRAAAYLSARLHHS